LDAIRDTLDDTPPELVSDLMETGICMAGGASQLKGLAERVSEEVNIRAWVAQDSMTCVARGAGKVLEELDTLREVLLSSDDRRPAPFGRL
jgi:rod shape-determining protein MreB